MKERVEEDDEEEQEEKICRIFHSPGDSQNPLQYPCACSGSMKFVHPKCLLRWMAQRISLECEVCKHRYSVHRVYAKNTPSRLPLREYLGGIVMKACLVLHFCLRFGFSVSQQLFTAPLIAFWIWRLSLVRSLSEAKELVLSYMSASTAMMDWLCGVVISNVLYMMWLHLGALIIEDEEDEEDGADVAIALAPDNENHIADEIGEDAGELQAIVDVRNDDNVAPGLQFLVTLLVAHLLRNFPRVVIIILRFDVPLLSTGIFLVATIFFRPAESTSEGKDSERKPVETRENMKERVEEDDEEEQEEKICRICHSPGDSENPLQYPCACSGSMKFVHPKCLLQWMKQRVTFECEVCKHKFSVYRVYAENTPTRLPLREFVGGIAVKACHVLHICVMFLVSVFYLLFMVPLLITWICRLYLVRSLSEVYELLVHSYLSPSTLMMDWLHGIGFLLVEAYSVGHQYEKFSDYPWCADICAVLVGTNCTALSFLVFLRCFVNIHAIYKNDGLLLCVVEVVAESLAANSIGQGGTSSSVGKPRLVNRSPCLYNVITLATGYMVVAPLVFVFFDIPIRTVASKIRYYLRKFLTTMNYSFFLLFHLGVLPLVLHKEVQYLFQDLADPISKILHVVIDDVQVQARQFLFSIAVNGILIVFLIYLPVVLAMQLTPTIFPLHISFFPNCSASDPFTEIPVVMLVLQLCLPYTIELRETVAALLHQWVTSVCCVLGLSRFLCSRPEDIGRKENVEVERQQDRQHDGLIAAQDPNKNIFTSQNFEGTKKLCKR
ncbi:hypothetical protein C5167_010580 [Papaver somniferum]|uniref:RING-CH-type domain-containing protein n=1 Tax=Papaver somniferum TaxID=3469 RepID=A0A4Y7K3I7_PAPSO|nr:hypothetical protein C5167_010580 [Papaver somniferum]